MATDKPTNEPTDEPTEEPTDEPTEEPTEMFPRGRLMRGGESCRPFWLAKSLE